MGSSVAPLGSLRFGQFTAEFVVVSLSWRGQDDPNEPISFRLITNVKPAILYVDQSNSIEIELNFFQLSMKINLILSSSLS